MRTELCNAPRMTTQRPSSGDGHATRNRAAGDQRQSEELPAGAFDLLAAQIENLRQEIDYVKEQVALLQENSAQHRRRGGER
jgi:hypothetical protein